LSARVHSWERRQCNWAGRCAGVPSPPGESGTGHRRSVKRYGDDGKGRTLSGPCAWPRSTCSVERRTSGRSARRRRRRVTYRETRAPVRSAPENPRCRALRRQQDLDEGQARDARDHFGAADHCFDARYVCGTCRCERWPPPRQHRGGYAVEVRGSVRSVDPPAGAVSSSTQEASPPPRHVCRRAAAAPGGGSTGRKGWDGGGSSSAWSLNPLPRARAAERREECAGPAT
jgi:hypothetical protein